MEIGIQHGFIMVKNESRKLTMKISYKEKPSEGREEISFVNERGRGPMAKMFEKRDLCT